MKNKPEVTIIPPRPVMYDEERKVGVYCRVSSKKDSQLESISYQISELVQKYSEFPYKIVDVFVDLKSAKAGSRREQFERLRQCCRERKLEYVVVREISRLGRNVEEGLIAIREMEACGVKIIARDYDSRDMQGELEATVRFAFAQAENDSRSKNIKWGIRKAAKDGTSKLYRRKCYGYKEDNEGELVIYEPEAKNVRAIFSMYLEGKSLVSIVKTLADNKIKSPSGNKMWSKRSIDLILSNEKYKGDVILLQNKGSEFYLQKGALPVIVTEERFDAVQEEKKRRSNITVNSDGKKIRKDTRYTGNK